MNCDEMDGDRLRLSADRNCYRLSRVSWALAQISCLICLPQNFPAPLADRRKILHHAVYHTEFFKLGPKFREVLFKKFWSKHAKFGPILDDFKFRRRISPEWMKIFKIGQVFDLPRFLARLAKKVRWTLVY